MSAARTSLLVLHAICIVAGLAYFAIAVIGHGDAPDANIGAGLALLWLGALGSPWTWPLFSAEVFGPLVVAGLVAGALLNLLLHAVVPTLVVRLRKRRSLS
jgi:hypothetical protein